MTLVSWATLEPRVAIKAFQLLLGELMGRNIPPASEEMLVELQTPQQMTGQVVQETELEQSLPITSMV